MIKGNIKKKNNHRLTVLLSFAKSLNVFPNEYWRERNNMYPWGGKISRIEVNVISYEFRC